jgi:hypothetical protein
LILGFFLFITVPVWVLVHPKPIWGITRKSEKKMMRGISKRWKCPLLAAFYILNPTITLHLLTSHGKLHEFGTE